MPNKVDLEITETPEDSPSSPVIVQSLPNQSAEQTIQAAIQIGESTQEAKQAAKEAAETLSEAESLLSKVQALLTQELAPIRERLEFLEKSTIQDEEEDIGENASVSVVEIEEQEPSTPEVAPEDKPIPEPERGGLFRKIFLNR